MTERNKPKRRRQDALIAALAERLRERGSWCGETHIQKAAFAAQELAGVPLGVEFILYKYGPFSFDLRDELGAMRANGFIDLESVQGYGPRLRISQSARRQLLDRFPRAIKNNAKALDFVADRLAGKGVGALERSATALWVIKAMPDAEVVDQAEALVEIKPHVPREAAVAAIAEVRDWQSEVPARGS